MADPIFDIRTALKERLPGADEDLALLLIAATRLGRILEVDLQQTARLGGLERSEHSVLTTLWLAGPDHPLSPTQLSQIVIQTTSGMTKTLRRLEERAFVERVPDPADGRRQLVRLTSPGRRLVERDTRKMLDRWQTRLRRYSRSEQAEAAGTLWSFVTFVEDAFLGRVTLGPRPPSDQRQGDRSARRRAAK